MKKLILSLFFLLSTLIGCTSVPIDTVNKRLAVFEIGYNEVLITVNLWINENRFNDNQIIKLKNQVQKIRTARIAIYTAKELGNFSEMDTKLGIANQSLLLLRSYLKQSEDSNNVNVKYYYSTGYIKRGIKCCNKITSFINKSRYRKPGCFGSRITVFT